MSQKQNEGRGATAARGIKSALKEGDCLVLDGGNQRILVRNVKSLGKGKYKGVIFGFSPSFVHVYEGLKVGDDLLFDSDDIVTDQER